METGSRSGSKLGEVVIHSRAASKQDTRGTSAIIQGVVEANIPVDKPKILVQGDTIASLAMSSKDPSGLQQREGAPDLNASTNSASGHTTNNLTAAGAATNSTNSSDDTKNLVGKLTYNLAETFASNVHIPFNADADFVLTSSRSKGLYFLALLFLFMFCSFYF